MILREFDASLGDAARLGGFSCSAGAPFEDEVENWIRTTAVAWIDRSPIDWATPPRVHRKEIRPPEVEAVLKIIEAAEQSRSPENALVLRLLAATGCRRGEVVGLHWGDVDFDADPVTVTIRRSVVEVERELIVKPTKTHAVRTVGLDPDTAALLRAQWTTAVEIGLVGGVPPKPEHFVFQRQPNSAEPMPPDRISQAWRRLCQDAGVKARLHDLRHLEASVVMTLTADRSASQEYRLALEDYLTRVVSRDGSFCCASAPSCRGSVRAGHQLAEGQLSYVGDGYVVRVDGREERILIVSRLARGAHSSGSLKH